MEDGDLWQAYNGDAIPSKEVEATDDDDNDTMIIEASSSPQEADTKSEQIPTSPPEECHEENNDAVTSTAAVANNPIITAQHAAQVVDVGPPVNIYAEAHRHANIATDRSESLNDDDGEHDIDVKVTRDGPHASLHLSNELKQQNKKEQQPDGNDTATSEKRAAAGETGENEAAATAEDSPSLSLANNNDDVQKRNNDAIDSEMEEVTDDVTDSDSTGSVGDGADSIVDTADQVATDQTDVITTDDSDVTKESEQPIDDDSATASISEEPSTDHSDVSTTKEPIKPLNRSRTVSEDEEEDDEEPKQKIQVDYASKLAGAQILEKSPTFKGASNLLTGDIDRYAIAPCDDKKYVVIGLSEDILVKEIKLSNFERYSSHVREFQVLASQEYPAPSAEYWNLIGTFEAHTRNGEQTFELEEPAWARYLKFKFRSHYGAEHYCTLSQIKVHGSTMLQGFHEQWIESEKELEQEKENQQQHQHQQQEDQREEEEEYNDDHQEQGEQEDVALAEKATEELTVGEEKGDEGGESDSLEQEQHVEPIEDTKEEDDIEGGADIVNDAPSYAENTDEELSSSGDDESSEDKNEEHTEQDEESTSCDQEASIPDEVPVSDQEDVTDVVTETAGDRVEPKEEKADKEVHHAEDSDKCDQPSQPDDDDDMTQAGSDGNAARDDDSAVLEVEEEIADSNSTATDIVQTEEILSADSALTDDIKTDTEVEASIEKVVNQDESSITNTLEAMNKTNDTTTTNPNSAPGDKVVDDATKTTPSKSVAIKKKEPEAIKKKEPEGENIPKGKDLPAKPIEKDATAKSSSPLTAEKNDNVKNAAMNSGELIAKISTRFPHASCIKDLDFHAFKSKTLLSNAGQLSQMTGPKMEPIFTKITNEIKSVQITQHQYEQYISAVKTCYEKLFLDMANDLDTIQRDYDRRLSNIEEVLSNVVPGGLSRPSNHRFMAVLPAVGVLFTSECAQLMFSVGFTVLMIFLRMRRKKKNLSNPSPSPKSSEEMKSSTTPAKEAVTTTPPATPMSSAAEVSPSSINNFEQHEEKEVHSSVKNSTSEPSLLNESPVKEEDDDVSGDKPPLVRIISNDEKENKSSVSIMSNNCSPPSMAQHDQIAKDLKVTC